MGKDKKIYAARMQGLAYALDIVKKGGIEALEKEIKARGAYYVPMEISYEQRMKVTQLIADRILDIGNVCSCCNVYSARYIRFRKGSFAAVEGCFYEAL